jgi:translation elongation factor EF-Tu-like GTPase
MKSEMPMRELVMKVDKFFNITDRNGIKFTVLGGVVECNKLRVGETVEIACPGNVLITGIENIKSYANDLEEAIRGQTVGLSFFGIHHMAFRINEPVVNPYNPETDLVKYLQWDNKANDAEGVLIYRGGNCRK